jgi:hypothetical protein
MMRAKRHECGIMGCNVVKFGEIGRFGETSPPSSESKSNQNKTPAEADGKLSLINYSALKMNTGFSANCAGSQPRRQHCQNLK